jgi:hypothetical protein
MERERGPLEKEIHEFIRMKGLSSPMLLNASVSGKVPTVGDRLLHGDNFDLVLMEMLLRLAREIDDLRASG